MDQKELNRIGKFISLILRHKPEIINLKLDKRGYGNVDDLIKGINLSKEIKYTITKDILKSIVDSDDKTRFSYSDDGRKIRANQGHSIDVDLGYEKMLPPNTLFHGTSSKSLESIYKSGIEKRNRHAVHLSQNLDTAVKVGSRHGSVVIIEIDSKKMYEDGFDFYKSDNGVWLVDHVPVKYFKLVF